MKCKAILIFGILVVSMVLIPFSISDPGEWWDSDYPKCQNITITNVGSSTLTNFPSYVNVTKDNNMQPDYDDLRFVDTYCDNGGNELAYELESYTGTNAHTWVKVNLSTGDNVISVYYGNEGASAGENPTAVWDDYRGVYHFSETTGNALDSSPKSYDATTTTVNSQSITGMIGNAYEFADAEHIVDIPLNVFTGDDGATGLTEFTLEIWQYPHVTANQPSYSLEIASSGHWEVSRTATGWRLRPADASENECCDTDITLALTQNVWQLTTVKWKAGEAFASYKNGVLQNAVTPTGTPVHIQDSDSTEAPTINAIGWNQDWGGYDGLIDDVRISSVYRSADWINQTYLMVAKQGDYVVFGDEESEIPPDITPPTYSDNSTNSTVAGTDIEHRLKWADEINLSGYVFQFCNGTWNGSDCESTPAEGSPNWANTSFDKCRNITVTNAGDSILSNFPVYVKLTIDEDMLDNLDDLRFYDTHCDNNGSLLNYEIENYTATNAYIWFNATLSTGDTIISVYYGNADAGSGENPTGVWDSSYQFVHHLEETSGATAYDSTSNSLNGAITGASYTSSGVVGGGYDFSGNDNIIVSKPIVGTTATVEFWEYTSSGASDNEGYIIVDKDDSTNLFLRRFSSGAEWAGLVGTVNMGTLAISRDTWQYGVVLIHGNGDFEVYANMNKVSDLGGSDFNTFTGDLQIANNAGLTRDYEGRIDEVRISSTDRTVDWINQTYQLIVNQGSFVTVGDEESYEEGIPASGGWANNTFVPMTGTLNWSNVTKSINSTVGITYAWCVHAKDNSNNWNSTSCENPFSYVSVGAITNCTNITESGSYYLQNDILGSDETVCINISANDVVLDCQGYTIDGKDIILSEGISLRSQNNNVTIKNCTVKDWYFGFYLDTNTENITINNISIMSSTQYGIFLKGTSNVIISNVSITNSVAYGILHAISSYTTFENVLISGSGVYDLHITAADVSSHCSHTFNNVKGNGGKPIVFYNHTAVTIQNWNNNFSQIILCQANSSVINNVNFTGSENNGITLSNTYDSNISNLIMVDSMYGLYLFRSERNIVNNIVVRSSARGVDFSNADNNILNNSKFYANKWGIGLSFGDNNIITNNEFHQSTLLNIWVYSSRGNLIYNNIFNSTVDISFAGIVYANSWNTTNQIGTRIYSNGTNIGGNYYTNSTENGYSDTCTDSDTDGFCDLYYNVSSGTSTSDTGDNVDYLPLSNKYEVTGTLNITWTEPIANDNHTQHTLKQYSFNVTCSDGNCGNVNVTLDPIEDEIVWKDNCQTRCIDGKCNTILGRTIWVNDSDGTCKPIEKAMSLKNGFYIEYLGIDPSFNLIVSEFNISYMDMTLTFEGNPEDYLDFCEVSKDNLSAKCDFKIDEKWNEYDGEGNVIEKSQLKFQYKWERDKNGIITKGDKVKYEYKENVMGKKFSFGGNSTTIQLQDADTENLADGRIYAGNHNNYGSAEYLTLRDGTSTFRFRYLIRFNISVIPLGANIESAIYDAYRYQDSVGNSSGDIVSLYEVTLNDWKESEFTWFNRTATLEWDNAGGDYNVTTEVNRTLGEVLNWDMWNVTEIVSNTYSSASLNVSFLIRYYIEASYTLYSNFYSKESVQTDLRPYLNITYSEAEAPAKGIINNTIGSIPFFHNGSTINYECGNMNDGDVCNATFWVNATGEINDTWVFYATASSTVSDSDISSEINITIIEPIEPEDTCTCPASGNWLIQCSDNCDIQACDMQTNNVLINGTGTAQGLRNITNATRIRIQGGCVAKW